MLDYIYLPRNFVSQRRNGGILCRSFKMLDVPLRCFIDHVQCIYYLLYILLPVFSDKHLYLFLGRGRVKEWIFYNIPNVLCYFKKKKKERKKKEKEKGGKKNARRNTSYFSEEKYWPSISLFIVSRSRRRAIQLFRTKFTALLPIMWQSGIETFIMTPRGNAAPAGANQSAPQSPGAGIPRTLDFHKLMPILCRDTVTSLLEKFPSVVSLHPLAIPRGKKKRVQRVWKIS